MDMSGFSEADLNAIASGDMASVSEEALNHLANYQEGSTAPIAPVAIDGVQERSLAGATGEAVGNIVPSGVKLAEGLYDAVANPSQSLGAINKLLGGYLQKGVDTFGGENIGITKSPEDMTQYADLMNQYMGERYGGGQEILNTLATDPAGLALDASMLLTGGGTAMAKIPGLAGTTGELLAKTGSVIDPIQNLVRAGKVGANVIGGSGKGARSLLGVTTGAGTKAVERAVTGGPEFEAALKGTTTQSDIVRASEEAMRQFRDIRRAKYTEDFAKVAENDMILDITPLKASFDDALGNFGVRRGEKGLDFSRSVLDGDPAAMEAMQFVENKLGTWGSELGDLTPVGLDTLKRNLDNYFAETNGARAVISDARGQVKRLLAENVEGYGKMTEEYQKATDFIHEIEKTFSTGGTPDTIMRKLNQAVKDNFEMRGALLERVDAELGTSLVDMIAGNQMSSWMAKNLVGRFAGMAAGGVLVGQGMSPAVIGALMVSSPKTVATMLRTLGVPKRAVKTFMKDRPKLRAQYDAIQKSVAQGGGKAQTAAKAAVVPLRVNQGQYDNLIEQGVQ